MSHMGHIATPIDCLFDLYDLCDLYDFYPPSLNLLIFAD